MAKKKLKDLNVGDSVICTGDSGFCDTSTEKIVKVTTKFDPNDGTPFPVIWLDSKRKFHGGLGHAISCPTAYYILSNTEENEQ